MSKQSRKTVLFVFLGIIFVIGLLWFTYFMFMLSPVSPQVDPLETTERVMVPSGEGLSEIAANLEELKLIRSGQFFKLYSFLSGRAHKLKPGLYDINPTMSSGEIVKQLVAGPGRETTILVREGDRVSQIEENLIAAAVLTGERPIQDFDVSLLVEDYPFLRGLTSLEGFLFPDTYRFFYASEPEDVIRVMLDNFVEKLSPLVADLEEYERRNIVIQRVEFTIEEILTIASLIEKEVPDSNERKLVSGIIYRRLRIGMPLQIDASVDYAENHGSRYDTYEFYGLPPGPIANPGLDAIEAALNPRTSSYLFYLSDPETDKTIFAKDFEEHKANQEEYLW